MPNNEGENRKENEPLPIKTFGVVLFRYNDVLLVRHGDGAAHRTGLYGIPAGVSEGKEQPKETASRECNEETGLQISPDMLIDYQNNYAVADILREDGLKKFSITAYLCPKLPREISLRKSTQTAPEWIPIDRLPLFKHVGLLLPNMQYIIKNAAKSYRNNF